MMQPQLTDQFIIMNLIEKIVTLGSVTLVTAFSAYTIFKPKAKQNKADTHKLREKLLK